MTRGRVALALALLLTAGLVSAVAKQKDKPASKVAQPMQPVGSDYVISPGDVLEVQVWKEPDVSKAVPVRPDGKISLPLLDDVQAAGRTSAALTADLTERLKKFISDPQVTVIVTEVNSQRIYITGEVTRGGTYPLEPGMTVLQGLSSAGGFTPFANVKKIYVLRQQNGKQVKYPFNYKDVVKGSDTAQNILLQPGDTIVVP
jgi:polysaccharide export outer membrane protein